MAKNNNYFKNIGSILFCLVFSLLIISPAFASATAGEFVKVFAVNHNNYPTGTDGLATYTADNHINLRINAPTGTTYSYMYLYVNGGGVNSETIYNVSAGVVTASNVALGTSDGNYILNIVFFNGVFPTGGISDYTTYNIRLDTTAPPTPALYWVSDNDGNQTTSPCYTKHYGGTQFTYGDDAGVGVDHWNIYLIYSGSVQQIIQPGTAYYFFDFINNYGTFRYAPIMGATVLYSGIQNPITSDTLVLVYATAVDRLGHESAHSDVASFYVDITAPSDMANAWSSAPNYNSVFPPGLNYDSGTNKDYYSSGDFWYSWARSADNFSGIKYYKVNGYKNGAVQADLQNYQLDTNSSGDPSYIHRTGQGDGTYYYYVTAYDLAGNPSTTKQSTSLVIDSQTPSVSMNYLDGWQKASDIALTRSRSVGISGIKDEDIQVFTADLNRFGSPGSWTQTALGGAADGDTGATTYSNAANMKAYKFMSKIKNYANVTGPYSDNGSPTKIVKIDQELPFVRISKPSQITPGSPTRIKTLTSIGIIARDAVENTSSHIYETGGSDINNVQVRIRRQVSVTPALYEYWERHGSPPNYTYAWSTNSMPEPNYQGEAGRDVWFSITTRGADTNINGYPWHTYDINLADIGINNQTWNSQYTNTISAKTIDNAGNEDENTNPENIPNVDFAVNSNGGITNLQVPAAANNTGQITMTFDSNLDLQQDQINVLIDGSPVGVANISRNNDAYTCTLTSIPGSDGTKSVVIRAIDVGGNTIVSNSANIILDTTRPSGTVAITPTGTNNGVKYSNNRDVQLVLNAADGAGSGVDKVRVWEGPTEPTSWQSIDYYSTNPFTLTADTTGLTPKTVDVRFQDRAGNPSTIIQDTITLDTTFPQAPIITMPENNKSYLTGLYIKGTAQDVLVSGDKGGSGIKQVVLWVRRLNPNPFPNQFLYWHADAWQASNTLNDPAMTLEANLHIQTSDQPDTWDKFINLVINNPSETIDIKARVFDAAGNTQISSGVDITVSNTIGYNLSPGVNWVSIALSGPTAVYNAQTIHIDTANDLWNALGLQDLDGDLIEVPIPGTLFYGQFYGGPSKPWNNFPVSYGKCYRVTTKFAKTDKQISGTVPTPARENHLFSLSPAPGVYWIFMPATKQNITKASELWVDLGLTAGDLIERSYPAGSTSYQYYGGTPSLGTDFSINVGDCVRVTTQHPIMWP